MAPLLSFCLSGRNDSYGGDFLWRIETSLNLLAANLDQIGRPDQLEVVITDWASETPLHRVLQLSAAARRLTRFVVVPPALGTALQKDSEFPAALAVNTAVRRSQGQFLACADSDCLCTTEFLEGLFGFVAGPAASGVSPAACFVLVPRRHIPQPFVAQRPPPEEIDLLIRRCGRLLYCDTGWQSDFAGAGMLLMHRDRWQESGGFDEHLLYWGWSDIELATRVTRRYPWINLQQLGLYLYHLDHHHIDPVTEPHSNRRLNPTIVNKTFNPNGPHWGLDTTTLPIVGADPPPQPASTAPAPAPAARIRRLRLWYGYTAGVCGLLSGKLSHTRWGYVFVRAIRRFLVIGRVLTAEPASQWVPSLRKHWRRYRANRARPAEPRPPTA